MKTARGWLVLFGVVALGQLGVPAWMIARQERVLHTGVPYKFRTQPVDPYDAFRGRYVALSLQPNSVVVGTNTNFAYRSRVYVTLAPGADGFATFTGAQLTRPAEGDYLRLEAWSSYDGKLTVRLPFDRYYMEEFRAPAAEREYWRHSRRENTNTYVTVRIKDGRGVIEELYVGGQPIRELLRENPPE